MLDSVFNIFTLIFNFIMGIFDRINSYVPFWGILLSLLFVYSFIKFFIAPFIGSRSSSSGRSVTGTRLKKGGK